MKSKEYGSDFHFINTIEFKNTNHNPQSFLEQIDQFCFSGRVALYSILLNGISKYKWEKIYVPTYYCHEIYDFIKPLDIEIIVYECNPFSKKYSSLINDEVNSVLLVVDYFGISKLDYKQFQNLIIIEDLTHNLEYLNNSKAAYCFGSLRKTLPLPVGGFIKDNFNKDELQLTDSLYADEITYSKFAAMVLKNKYLLNEIEEKHTYRSLYVKSEQQFENLKTIANLPFFVKEYLFSLDVKKLLDLKKKNSKNIKNLVPFSDEIEVFKTENNNEFAFILKFVNKDKRDKMRNLLIENNIYPMVLWPSQITDVDREIENTLLFIHIDFRYKEEDIYFIANVINQFK